MSDPAATASASSSQVVSTPIETIRILNIDIHNTTFLWALENLKKGILYTPNVDHIMKLQKDREFYDLYMQATHLSVDSKIVMLVAKFLGKSFKEQVAGSDFLPAYCYHHRNNPEIRVFLLGGSTPETPKKAMEITNKKAGRNVVVGYYFPPFGFDKSEVETKKILATIKESGANVLAVGVGAPKQEKWIAKHKDQLPEIDLFMGVGATIDFMAGNLKRSPEIYTKLHIEWLHRLLSEPKRMWKRYLVDDPPFFWLIFKQKMGWYKNPWA